MSSPGPRASRPHDVAAENNLSVAGDMRARRPRSQDKVDQIAFDFDAEVTRPEVITAAEFSLDDQVRIAASDYQLQMQAYALAVRELMPALNQEGSAIISTLHFLEPNVEFHLSAELLAPDVCGRAIDGAMVAIVSSREAAQFPVRPHTHCRMCNFLGLCPAGRDRLRSLRPTNGGD